MTTLLDANVLIALTVSSHLHHAPAGIWLNRHQGHIATCPITQGAVMRMLLRERRTPAEARQILGGLAADDRHEFWPDNLPYADVRMTGMIGHRQVTDAYLAALARARDGQLATFDRGLAALHPDVAELIPTT